MTTHKWEIDAYFKYLAEEDSYPTAEDLGWLCEDESGKCEFVNKSAFACKLHKAPLQLNAEGVLVCCVACTTPFST